VKDLERIKTGVEQLRWAYQDDKKIDESKILVRQGEKAFYNIIENLADVKEYDYAIRWNYGFHKELEKQEKDRIQKGVDIKILTRYDKETAKNVKKWAKVHKNIRTIENEGVSLDILDDKEVMITITGCNATILVKDAAFAKVMKKMFLETYKNAKEV
jgi:hypothetical protein